MPMVTLALKGSAISAKHADKNDPALKIIIYLQNGNYQKPANGNIATCADIIFASGNNADEAMAALTDYLAIATNMSVKDTSKALSRLL